MSWSIAEVATEGEADDVYAELTALYAVSDSCIWCPAFRAIPKRLDLTHWINDATHSAVAIRRDGDLSLVLLMGGGVYIRSGWGAIDPEAHVEMATGPLLEFAGGEVGVDSGMKGWVARKWIEQYMAPIGPFELPTHIADYDQKFWTLRWWRDPVLELDWSLDVVGS